MPEAEDDPGGVQGEEPSTLSDVFEDLEQQAAGLHLASRDAERADRAHGEYAQVTLASRLHASVGRQVRLDVRGGVTIEGTLHQVGEGWCRIGAGDDRGWVVPSGAVTAAVGLSPRSLPDAVRPATARLGLRSALRGLCEAADVLTVVATDGAAQRLRVQRVGADFLEARREGGATGEDMVVVPFTAVAAIRQG